ncbi:dihydrofolate reductase [Candidatus Phytoplasma solani]|uniref:dihydrofolate reductase n=1 Tax=Candidatus Phytoplasma solani TaxID=69896 RepID=A0A421NXI1_9MOLU|nr:dihydrofolate reductase [Candidatus Phytoplasma solani]RMI88737.1 dihydrofolate reductase [Candidatus Phytoplasma solani]CCP88597.1 Dihydrofolate reductase [Candidatus Phytoplasma solani]
MISLITAFDSNYLIGFDNKLPWHYPDDLQYFKKMTFNQEVLMGYQTYLSLKSYFKDKPFYFKKTYVASLQKDLQLPNCEVVFNLANFLKTCATNPNINIFIIGGRQIYRQALPYTKFLYITHILNRYQGNVYFPKIDWQSFQLMQKTIQPQLIFTLYQRKNEF